MLTKLLRFPVYTNSLIAAGKQGSEGTLWHVLSRLLVLYLQEASLQAAQQAVANATFLLPMLLDLRAPASGRFRAFTTEAKSSAMLHCQTGGVLPNAWLGVSSVPLGAERFRAFAAWAHKAPCLILLRMVDKPGGFAWSPTSCCVCCAALPCVMQHHTGAWLNPKP